MKIIKENGEQVVVSDYVTIHHNGHWRTEFDNRCWSEDWTMRDEITDRIHKGISLDIDRPKNDTVSNTNWYRRL